MIMPAQTLYCNIVTEEGYCGSPLLLHNFFCYKHSYKPELLHCDVHLKCPRCGYHYTFGLAVPPELYERLRQSRYHGRVLRMELREIYGGSLPKEVERRLRDLGYW